jgi:hypothetical protein
MVDYNEGPGDGEPEEGLEPQDDSLDDSEEIDDLDESVEDEEVTELSELRQSHKPDELLPEDEEEDGYAQEDEEEEAEEEEEEEAQAPRGKGNVHAALRVTERRLEASERNNQILANRFNQLLEAIQSGQLQQPRPGQGQAEETPDEEIPEFDADPMGNIGGRMGKLEKLVEKFVTGFDKKDQINTTQNALREIDNATVAYAQTIGPANYADAIQYLAQVKVREELLAYPHLTENEAVQSVAQRVINDKIRWAQQGLNPGEQWIKQATNLGWRRGAASARNSRGAATDGRDEVARKREKDAKGRTISRAPGTAARKNLTVDDILRYPERDWDTLMRRSAKSLGKKPNELKFSDIMPPMR